MSRRADYNRSASLPKSVSPTVRLAGCAFVLAFLLASPAVSTYAIPGSSGPEAMRSVDNLQVGDSAPDFQLTTFDSRTMVRLSSLTPQKPVVLIFGSYT